VFAALRQVAPEVDPAAVDHAARLVTELDLDSMDFAMFLEGVSDRLGVDIPEADYSKVQTIDDILTYVSSRRATFP
jgi:acyl carrier protein